MTNDGSVLKDTIKLYFFLHNLGSFWKALSLFDFWFIYFHLPVMWGHPVFKQHSIYMCVFWSYLVIT